MAYSWRTFGDGTLPAAKTALVTIAALHSATLTVKLTNLLASPVENINVYVNANGTSRHIFPKDLKMGVGRWVESSVEELEEGDTIEGSAPVTGTIEYRISGLDRE